MDSLTTETRDIGDIAGLRGQCLQRWQAGVVLSAFMRASTTRGYGGVAVRRPHQPCGFLLRIARSGEEDGGGVRPANLGAAVQFSCANAVRRIPLGHVPKVRPYRRAGYGPRIVGDGVRTVNANDVRCPEARADNRGIGGCQQRRFASARKSLLLPMCADTAVCHSKPLILFGSGTPARGANKINDLRGASWPLNCAKVPYRYQARLRSGLVTTGRVGPRPRLLEEQESSSPLLHPSVVAAKGNSSRRSADDVQGRKTREPRAA